MYTPIIAPADLKTHIYSKIVDEISRADTTIPLKAIATGIEEVKIYLNRYDLVQLFGNDTVAATFTNDLLTDIVKCVSVWKLILLAQPNVDIQMIRTRYEDAIATLKAIQAGKANPEWPYKDTTAETAPQGRTVKKYSSEKRNNEFY